MTERHSLDPPLASANSWPSRRPPSPAYDDICEAFEAQATKTAEWLETQSLGGIIPPSERIVIECLRALNAIPKEDSMYADVLAAGISRVFLETAWGLRNHKRRAAALMRIAGRPSL